MARIEINVYQCTCGAYIESVEGEQNCHTCGNTAEHLEWVDSVDYWHQCDSCDKHIRKLHITSDNRMLCNECFRELNESNK